MEADVSLKCAIFGVTWALHAGSELRRTPSRRSSLRLRARPPQPASGTADDEPHPLRYSANLRPSILNTPAYASAISSSASRTALRNSFSSVSMNDPFAVSVIHGSATTDLRTVMLSVVEPATPRRRL